MIGSKDIAKIFRELEYVVRRCRWCKQVTDHACDADDEYVRFTCSECGELTSYRYNPWTTYKDYLREQFADLAHEQWVSWSKGVAHEVSPERRERWEKLWVPYHELEEKEKDKDRVWADRYLQLIKSDESLEERLLSFLQKYDQGLVLSDVGGMKGLAEKLECSIEDLDWMLMRFMKKGKITIHLVEDDGSLSEEDGADGKGKNADC